MPWGTENDPPEHTCDPADPILRLAGFYYQCSYCGGLFKTYAECLAHIPAAPPTVYECTKCAPCPICGWENCVTRTSEVSQADACTLAQNRANELLEIHMQSVHPPAPKYAKAHITDHKAPSEAAVGETITLGGTIKNVGEGSGRCRMVMHHSNRELAWGSVGTVLIDEEATLDVGSSMTKSKTMTMPEYKLYSYIDAYHFEESWVQDERTGFGTKIKEIVAPPPAEWTDRMELKFYRLPWADKAAVEGAVTATLVPVINAFEWIVGYDYLGYVLNWDGMILNLYYKKRATPVITAAALASVLTAIAAVLIAIGVIILAVAWYEAEKRIAEESVGKKQLLDAGKITSDQYTELVKAQKESPAPWEKVVYAGIAVVAVIAAIYVLSELAKKRKKE